MTNTAHHDITGEHLHQISDMLDDFGRHARLMTLEEANFLARESVIVTRYCNDYGVPIPVEQSLMSEEFTLLRGDGTSEQISAHDIISVSVSAAAAEDELGLRHLTCREELEGLAAIMSENLRREGVDVDTGSIIDALDELIRLAAYERQAEGEDAEAA